MSGSSARAKFIVTFVGMDRRGLQRETAPGGWTYQGIARHLIQLDQDSLKTVHADIAASVEIGRWRSRQRTAAARRQQTQT